MMIVDAQIHIWGPRSAQRPWVGEGWRSHRSGSADGAMGVASILREMDAAGVARAILVPPTWENNRNDVGLDAAARYPRRLAVMGRLPLCEPSDKRALDALMDAPGMLGVRVAITTPEERHIFAAGAMDWLWRWAERTNVPIMLLPPGLLPEIADIADRHPDLRIAIDHLARHSHGPKDDAAFADMDDLVALASRANVAVKASALPAYSSEKYPFPALHKYIRQAFDAFGPERMFWGSDLTRLQCSYGECVDLFLVELPWLSRRDKELIMGRAVCAWLGWEATEN